MKYGDRESGEGGDELRGGGGGKPESVFDNGAVDERAGIELLESFVKSDADNVPGEGKESFSSKVRGKGARAQQEFWSG